MRDVSEYTKVVENLVKKGLDLAEEAARTPVVPFMQERVSRRTALARMPHLTRQDLLGMTPEQRKELVDAVGVDEVMKVIRRGGA